MTCEQLGSSLALDVETLELVLRVLAGGGYVVRENDHVGWLADAGFTGVESHAMPFAPFQLLATGRVPELDAQ